MRYDPSWVAAALLALLLAGCGGQQSGRVPGAKAPGAGLVLVDGRPDEPMNQMKPILDRRGDSEPDAVDFDTVRVQVQEGRLVIRINLNQVIGLQNGSDLTLLLDTDNNPTTGTAADQPGAELAWMFGKRAGQFMLNGTPQKFKQGEFGLITAPTITSDVFEMAIPLDAAIQGRSVFLSDRIGLAFLFQPAGVTTDRVPDKGYAPVDLSKSLGEPELLPVARTNFESVRFLTWNVLFDGIVERSDKFAAIFSVLQPDIVILAEVWDTPAAEAAKLFNEWMPLGGDSSWHSAKYEEADVIALSRWPILQGWKIPDARASAFLLQMPAGWSTPLLLIGAHPPCCGKDEARQLELDAIIAFLRDARSGAGEFSLPPGAPVIIAGDMNLVGYREQLATLVEGKIVNARYGRSFGPDSDGSSFTDLFPRHPADMLVYTWRDDGSNFGPGKLDYVIYSDHDIRVVQSLVFDTRLLPDSVLAQVHLTHDSSPDASDHVPVVADLTPR